jgi:hypothetical protein
MLPEGIRRGLEALIREGRMKQIVEELKLPKEIINHINSQVDETKQAALSVVARETRAFLENTDLAEELSRLLSKFSLEVKTEIRFVPRRGTDSPPDREKSPENPKPPSSMGRPDKEEPVDG